MIRTSRLRRLIVGIFVLLVVNILWVASSELTKYLFESEEFRRPFFTTYAKTSLFMLYLLGFVCHKPWRDQCVEGSKASSDHSVDVSAPDENDNEQLLSEPVYQPLRHCSDSEDTASIAASENDLMNGINDSAMAPRLDRLPSTASSHSVRFNQTAEVRHLPESEAEAAALSRLTYEAWLRWLNRQTVLNSKLPMKRVVTLSLQFCFVWFFGNYAYQMALNSTEAGVVNVLSSSSALFTLILAALFPACATDKFTVSKLCAVLLSVGGVVIITWMDETTIEFGIPKGVAWALAGAVAYAIYVVFLRRSAESEDKLDISMFFGFVGLFNTVLLCPGLYILHATNVELFYPLPNRTQAIILAVNGLVGTVLADFLWLWGCFLTSSLIATLALSLTVPMSFVADAVIRHKSYPWQFALGSLLIVFAFILASLLSHTDNWDPVRAGLRQILDLLCTPCRRIRNRLKPLRVRTLDSEQQRSLISDQDA